MALSSFPQKQGAKKRIKHPEISLPMDLVMEEILTRLPPKALMRFKCISKLWSSLIRSRFFGHDPVNDQYKVLCSISVNLNLLKEIRTEHWFFVLEPGEGSWRKVSDICSYVPFGNRPCINGVIYYKAYKGTIKLSFVIRSFHIRSEEFKTIEIPPNVLPKNYSLIEYVGKLTLLDHTDLGDKGMLDFWVLEDAVNKEWLRNSLVLQPSQLHLVNNTKFYVSGTTQNGKVLFTPQYFTSPFYFLCYDLQNNDMKKIEINGIQDHWFSKYKGHIRLDIMFMDHRESVVHLE